jgi:hypothetical protein
MPTKRSGASMARGRRVSSSYFSGEQGQGRRGGGPERCFSCGQGIPSFSASSLYDLVCSPRIRGGAEGATVWSEADPTHATPSRADKQATLFCFPTCFFAHRRPQTVFCTWARLQAGPNSEGLPPPSSLLSLNAIVISPTNQNREKSRLFFFSFFLS